MIIETDLGHDPDDFFTICLMIYKGVRISSLCIVPGDSDQIASGKLIRKIFGLDFPIIAAKESSKLSSGNFHHNLCKKAGVAIENQKADSYTTKDISPDDEVLIIGPATNTKRIILAGKGKGIKRITMQGGFCPYHLYLPAHPVENFLHKNSMPTFNFNGDREAVASILALPNVSRRFCGKNVCHSVILEPGFVFKKSFAFLNEAMKYMEKSKKFHDPIAGLTHIKPELGIFIKGTPSKDGGGWTTIPNEYGDEVLVDLNRKEFWDELR